jgi:hypothetical protein
MIQAVRDPDPLVRVAAVTGLDQATPNEKLAVVPPLLRDPIRAVRIQAARTLAGMPADRLEPARREEFTTALVEYRQAQLYNADVPSGNLNLAILETLLPSSTARVHYHRDPVGSHVHSRAGQPGESLQPDGPERGCGAHSERRRPVTANGELHYSLGLLLAEEMG